MLLLELISDFFLPWKPGFSKLGKFTFQKGRMNGNGHVAYRWKGLATSITKTLFVCPSVAPNSNDRMTRLTTSDRHRVLALLDAGVGPAEVARRFNVNERTLRRHVRRYRETGDVRDRPRSGRPRCTTQRQDRWIVSSHLRDRARTAVESARNFPGDRPIHPQTIRNRLRVSGLTARRPAIRPILEPRHLFFIFDTRMSFFILSAIKLIKKLHNFLFGPYYISLMKIGQNFFG